MAPNDRFEALGLNGLQRRQRAELERLVGKHLGEAGVEAFRPENFTATETELGFGVQGQKHDKLVAVLEVLNDYQQCRQARSPIHVGGYRASWKRQYRDDPRTQFIELLKRWLRISAGSTDLEEQKVRQVANLTRDLLNYRDLFPSRNHFNFIAAIGKAHKFLAMQLGEMVRSDKACVHLAQQIIDVGKELLSASIVFLLLGPTDLAQTDSLKALQVCALWETLPQELMIDPLHSDPQNAKAMKRAWRSKSGSAVAALLSSPCVVKLFAGQTANSMLNTPQVSGKQPSSKGMLKGIRSSLCWKVFTASRAGTLVGDGCATKTFDKVEEAFSHGRLRNCGLAGPFRTKQPLAVEVRKRYIQCVKDVYNFAWLLSEVFPLFKRVSDNLGDYGMICLSPALRPFLGLLSEKIMQLRASLEFLNEAMSRDLVMPRSLGQRIAKPVPSGKMAKRAFDAIERAVLRNGDSITDALLGCISKLRDRADPSRLHEVMAELGRDVRELRAKIASQQFRECAGSGPAAALADAVSLPLSGVKGIGDRSPEGPQRQASSTSLLRQASSTSLLRQASSRSMQQQPSPTLGRPRLALPAPADDLDSSASAPLPGPRSKAPTASLLSVTSSARMSGPYLTSTNSSSVVAVPTLVSSTKLEAAPYLRTSSSKSSVSVRAFSKSPSVPYLSFAAAKGSLLSQSTTASSDALSMEGVQLDVDVQRTESSSSLFSSSMLVPASRSTTPRRLQQRRHGTPQWTAERERSLVVMAV